MTKLTEKQQAFVVNKIAGVANRDAAIAAGYSITGAAVAADKLMHNPAVRKAIEAATPSSSSAPGSTMPRDEYIDPLPFLMDVMNHKGLPLAMRTDAAKQLLPYHHTRKGELGKKELAQQQAHDAVNEPRSLFSPRRPPKFHSIPGSKED